MTQCILDDLMFSRAACPAREATVAPSTLVIVVLEGWRHQAGRSSAMLLRCCFHLFPVDHQISAGFLMVSAGKLTFRGCSSNSGGAIKVTAGGVTRRCRWRQEKRAFLMSEGCSPCSLGIWCYRSKKWNKMTRCLNICQINPNDINLLQFVVCRNSQAEFSNGTFLFEDCIADTGGAVSVSRRRE